MQASSPAVIELACMAGSYRGDYSTRSGSKT